jgi:MFS family permease
MLLRTASTFRRLWVGQFVSTIGDGMQRIALLWWATQNGGNGLLVAVALCTIVPTVVCSPVGGWFADHVDRRRLMVGADVVRLGLSGLLAALLFGGDPPVAIICVLVALAATLNMVVAPVPILIAALAIDRFHAGPTTFGLLEMLLSAGLLIGSIAAGVLARGRLALPFHVLGVCLAVTGVVPLAGAAIALVVGGVAIAVANAEAMTRVQRSVPGDVQGRVFGVLGSLSEGLRPAGLALGAPVLTVAGVSGAFVVIGTGVVLATAVLAREIAPTPEPAIRVAAVHPGVRDTLG